MGKRFSKKIFVICLLLLFFCLGASAFLMNSQIAEAATGGDLNGIVLAQDKYDESSDDGISWGNGDHMSYDGHIRFSFHNAAGVFGADLTDWTKGRVSDISGSLVGSVSSASFRFTVYVTGKTSEILDDSNWGYGQVIIKLYKNGTYLREAEFSCDMSRYSNKYNTMYIGSMSYGTSYKTEVSFNFATSDGASWGNYQGNWTYEWTLRKRQDYDISFNNAYHQYKDGVYYYNRNYSVTYNDRKTVYRSNNDVYCMPSLNAKINSSTINSGFETTDQGFYNYTFKDHYSELIQERSTCLDTTAPTGYVKAVDGSIVTGSYYNDTFEYYAEDDLSGIDYCEYKTSSNNSWQRYTLGTRILKNNGDGAYSFRCVDNAGNYSDVTTINMDTVSPQVSITDSNNSILSDGSAVNVNLAAFFATDNASGISRCYLKTGNGNFVQVENGYALTESNSYRFYCIDGAGNTSETYSLTIDMDAPALSCSGAEFGGNASTGFTVSAADALSGTTLYYRVPSGNYTVAANNTITIPATSEDGKYYFYAVDGAGNMSDTFWVGISFLPPEVNVVYSDTDNSAYAEWNGDFTVKLDGEDYHTGQLITGEGVYELTVRDNLTGRTNVYQIIIDHFYVYDSTVPPTCTEDGYDICICSECGAVSCNNCVPATGHDYTVEIYAPTCTEEGYTEYTCTVCGDTFTQDHVPATGHNYSVTVVSPTCVAQGYTVHTCLTCGFEYMDNYVLPLGHVYEETVVAPTCTERGYSIYSCKKCDYEYIGNYVVPLGHKYTNESFDATCTEGGGVAHECERCGDTYSEYFSQPKGHIFHEETFEPTCTEDGYVYHICHVCGYEYRSDIVKALGHEYKTHIETDADCLHSGDRVYRCERCGDEYHTEIPYSGHQYVMTETESESGLKRTYVCEECGETYVDYMENKNELVSNYIEYLFGQYSPYMIWVFLATSGVWSAAIGVAFILAWRNEDKEKAKKMLINYGIGLIVIFGILVACPYLIRGIAYLVTG